MRKVSEIDLTNYVVSRGFQTEQILNDIASDQDGKEPQVVGIRLRGPRGIKTTMAPDNGFYDLDQATLWCDATDYATNKISRKHN